MTSSVNREIEFSDDPWDPDEIDWISTIWDSRVDCVGGIVSSVWVIPAGWTSLNEETDVGVTDCDGVSHSHANRIRLSTTNTGGTHVITNRVVFADTSTREKSVKIRIA